MSARARVTPGRAGAMIVGLTALAITGCGGEKSSEPSKLDKQSIPAAVVSSPHSFIGGESISPLKNAWRTGDAKRFTQVEAGAIPGDDSVGVLAIFRYRYKSSAQDANLVKVIGAGPLEITRAPTGPDVESKSQRTGRIGFSSENGARGTLDLRNDSIRLDARPWEKQG